MAMRANASTASTSQRWLKGCSQASLIRGELAVAPLDGFAEVLFAAQLVEHLVFRRGRIVELHAGLEAEIERAPHAHDLRGLVHRAFVPGEALDRHAAHALGDLECLRVKRRFWIDARDKAHAL